MGLAWWRSASLPRRAWRAIPEWQRQNRYEVRGQRFQCRTEKTSHDIAYDEIFSWLETPSAFYLEQTPTRFFVLPKRGFESSAAIDATRGVFAASIHGRKRPARYRLLLLYTLFLWVLLVAMFVAVYSLTR